MSDELQELYQQARKAAENAYAPYSGYKVGSALKCRDGSIYTACNVENASYSLTICAERNAIFKAISEGKREFEAIAIYVDSEKTFAPCGACRQVLMEFAPDLQVVYNDGKGLVVRNLGELLPGSFQL